MSASSVLLLNEADAATGLEMRHEQHQIEAGNSIAYLKAIIKAQREELESKGNQIIHLQQELATTTLLYREYHGLWYKACQCNHFLEKLCEGRT
ncbi:hypothetical protein A0H81_03657 [Grifola frondosa]|uniref:Uncharacterized protein n=1 Tax=Grifola frondosa TaxID=5627 RepID=A0A1C7MKN0_GRIFR|nr:hypothetical protein A0H81_03657 [Grifola frondosa]